ncbi:MAG: enoyl-CoA hydratase/isomerase family protein, partial [Roseovarius sp.]
VAQKSPQGEFDRLPGVDVVAAGGVQLDQLFPQVDGRLALRFAAEGAGAFYPVMKLGFLPQPGDPARLAALIGPARARMILLTGARLDTGEALDWGLFDRVVPRDGLMQTTRDLAANALAAPPDHATALKAMCRAAG